MSNETVDGIQLSSLDIEAPNIVCDMSSDLFSRELNVNKFSYIYAALQKNLGLPGASLLIIKKDFKQNNKNLPNSLSYDFLQSLNGCYSTPPVLHYICLRSILKWLKRLEA